MNRYLGAIALAVAVTLAIPDAASASTPDTAAADYLAGRINAERAAAGLAAVSVRADIAEIAMGQSVAMASRADLWHNDAYFAAGTRARLGARALGENVAYNGSIEDAHLRLMASPGHRANILNPAFDAVGIAVVVEGSTFYVTEDFVDTADAVARPKAKAKAKVKAPRRPRRPARRGRR